MLLETLIAFRGHLLAVGTAHGDGSPQARPRVTSCRADGTGVARDLGRLVRKGREAPPKKDLSASRPIRASVAARNAADPGDAQPPSRRQLLLIRTALAPPLDA